jgi:ribosomal protein S2
MCKEVGRFIFEFIYLEGFNNKTEEQIEILDEIIKYDINLDKIFKIIFSNKTENNLVLSNELKEGMFEFLKGIGERGFMTLMGMRYTPGSITCLPPDIDSLIKGFKDLNTKNTNENNKNKKPSGLTVGARALCKHSHRSTEVIIIKFLIN